MPTAPVSDARLAPPPVTFSHARYDALVAETFETVKRLSKLKGGEYAGDDDRLANFRRNAADLDLPMETIWRIYAAKHWDAVGQYIRDLQTGKTRERLEPLAGRLDDLIVYCLLFKAMLDERQRLDGAGELKRRLATPFLVQAPSWLAGKTGSYGGHSSLPDT